VDISDRLQQVVGSIDEGGLVASTEKLTVTFVATIVSLGVYPVQMTHAS